MDYPLLHVKLIRYILGYPSRSPASIVVRHAHCSWGIWRKYMIVAIDVCERL